MPLRKYDRRTGTQDKYNPLKIIIVMNKLWEKGITTAKSVEEFTTSTDRVLDKRLAPYDVLGSIAHARMLHSIEILTSTELTQIEGALKNIMNQIKAGEFDIEEGVEDVHSQVEIMLTRELGETGKKLHTGRSRNDQVLVDLKLFTREELKKTVNHTHQLFLTLIKLSNKYKDVLMPGYTHMQVAMPSSFGLWFGAFAESLVDDLQLLLAAYRISDQNPLGSAAGYGSSFPINRTLTTQLLGFNNLQVNVAYAQVSRSKNERTIAYALASLANTLSRLAMDVCLFSGQNFNFFSLPDEFTTGSSIMPHKKNPDAFELIRARCNKLMALPLEISLVSNNLPSGYNRDYQVNKESFMTAFDEINECIIMTNALIEHLQVKPSVIDDEMYDAIFSVEEVNKLVLEGVPFRDAYKIVAAQIKDGSFKAEKNINHTHEGSIGNLGNDLIEQKLDAIMYQFNFMKSQVAMKSLLGEYLVY
jgi:argininosuccinate lyase